MWCATIQGSEKRDGQFDGWYEATSSLVVPVVPGITTLLFSGHSGAFLGIGSADNAVVPNNTHVDILSLDVYVC